MKRSDLIKVALGLLFAYLVFTMYNKVNVKGCENCKGCQSNGCENCKGCQDKGCENCAGCKH